MENYQAGSQRNTFKKTSYNLIGLFFLSIPDDFNFLLSFMEQVDGRK